MFEVERISRIPLLVSDESRVSATIIIKKSSSNDIQYTENVKLTVNGVKSKNNLIYGILVGMREKEVRSFITTYSELSNFLSIETKFSKSDKISCSLEVTAVDNNLPNIDIKVKQNTSVENDSPPLLFLHGWPDDERVFEKQIGFLSEKGFKCLYYTLPWFGEKHEAERIAKEKNYSTDGYTHTELADAVIYDAYQVLNKENNNFNVNLILIGHDWGAYHSQVIKLRHSHLIQKSVLIDILFHDVSFYPSFSQVPYIMKMLIGYQFRQAFFNRFASVNKKVSEYFIGNAIKSFNKLKSNNILAEEEKSVYASFVYYKYQKDYWLKLLNIKTNDNIYFYELGSNKKIDRRDKWKENIFYIYGIDKPFHFHSDESLKAVEDEPTSIVTTLKSFHWIPEDCPDELNELLFKYLTNEKELFTALNKSKL